MIKIFQFAEPIRLVAGRHGFMTYNKHCQWVGKALELYGEYCEFEVELFSRFIKPTDVVWEIGANTGSQAVALSKFAAQGRYIGFEPQIELFKILATNLTLNGCENGLPLNLALGDADGIINLPSVNYHLPTNFGSISLIDAPKNGMHKVEVRRIDGLDWLPAPNFMKIDVEGMESMVLRGGERTIATHRPLIYVENDRLERSSDLIQALWDFGYVCYWHNTPYFNPNNFFGNRLNVYERAVSFNMFCVHTDSPLKIEGLERIDDKNRHPLNSRSNQSAS